MLFAATATVVAAAGCSSSGTTAPGAGDLLVTISAPKGVTANVTVTGPAGYTKSLTATATLTGLTSGSYTVSAAPATTTDPIVATRYSATISGSPATLSTSGAGATVKATYAEQPGSGGLWIANGLSPATVVKYTAAQLAGAASTPATTIKSGGSGSDVGIAFDASGNLWVASNGNIVQYSAEQLKASGTPTAAVTLTASGTSLDAPEGVAFDAGGNLWVTNSGNSTLVEFAASQLAASGSPTAAVTISAPGGAFTRPVGLAFDAAGDLWVANFTPNTVVEYTPAQLAATGDPTPTITLTGVAMSISGPQLVAFDATGNLWVANGEGLTVTTIEAFSPAQLATSGHPTPAIVLSSFTPSNVPAGLAFDASGDLWVSTINSLVEFTPSQIAATGAPTPAITITNSALAGSYGVAFDPHPTGFPLQP
jgi:sugar lactone lactonase YvrE